MTGQALCRNSRSNARCLALLAGGATILLTGVAAAQNTPPQKGIEEVVVTARKRPEKLRDLALTASVIGQKKLQQENISDIADLNRILPAVNLNGTFNGRVPLAIRGVQSDSNEAAIGITSGVGIEVDGVPIPSDSFAANNVEDIANVELLEGPQATLGGRTATSGLINYVTPGPTDTYHGSLSALATTDNEQNLYGHVSGPITDMLSFSASGWGHHTQFPVENTDTGNHSSQSNDGFRLKLKAVITDDFNATLSGSLQQTRSKGFNFAYSYVYPGAYILAGPGGGPPFWSQQALFPPNIHIGDNNTDFASPVPGIHENRTDGNINLLLNYQLGDYALSSLTSYQHETRDNSQDLFAVNEYFGNIAHEVLGAPLEFNNTQSAEILTSQVSEELKVATPSSWRLNYVAGIFFSDTNVHEVGVREFAPAWGDSTRTAESITADGYVHGNYTLFDGTTLTGGVRFNHDYINYSIFELANAYAVPVPPTVPQPVPPATNIYTADQHESMALVGDIGIKQQITPTVQAYFTYTRGYAPEAYNTAYTYTVPGAPLTPVAQTHIDSFEIGTKGRYFNNTLQVDLSLFDTIYDNYQINTFVNVPGEAVGVESLSAAGAAETRGGEANVTWQPMPLTTLNFAGALIDAQFNSYQNGPCYWSGPASLLPNTCYIAADGSFHANLSHRSLPNAPKLKFSISADQGFMLDDRDELLLGGSASYRSRTQMLPDQNPYGFEPAYALLNVHATIQRDGGKYAFTVLGDNVTATHYSVDVEDFWASPWSSNAIVRQPARDTNGYVGFRFDTRF
jgi:iron complex outermembrane receptor protein